MNSLLNIFCYIISNVSIIKNLHRVQLMTESYPDRQYYSKNPRGMTRFAQSIWGNPVKIQRISQKKKIKGRHLKWVSNYFPINLGQSSQDSENLSRMPKVIRGMHPSKSESISNQHGALS